MSEKTCYNCFGVLSDKNRMTIVSMLKKDDFNVKGLAAQFNIGQPTLSHHLAVLRKAGMVKAKKRGREMIYSFNKKHPCSDCGIFKNLKLNASNKKSAR